MVCEHRPGTFLGLIVALWWMLTDQGPSRTEISRFFHTITAPHLLPIFHWGSRSSPTACSMIRVGPPPTRRIVLTMRYSPVERLFRLLNRPLNSSACSL